MQADRKMNNCIGVVTKNDIPLVEPYAIMKFLEKVLLDVVSEIEIDDEEDHITQKIVQLSIVMDSSWVFIQQNKNKGSRASEDIGVSPKSNPTKVFFVIEAKRLPSSSKKEYIIGNTGGIERFKREKHAKNFFYAGMIGYVQNNDIESWEKRINAWIDEEITTSSSSDLIWSNIDKLNCTKSIRKLSKYSSKHLCISGKNIELIHLLIDVS